MTPSVRSRLEASVISALVRSPTHAYDRLVETLPGIGMARAIRLVPKLVRIEESARRHA
jgi:hypothetical protein